MQAGAADYLTKDGLEAATLERTLRHAVERHHDRRALRQLNEALESRVQERTRELEEANAALRTADRNKDQFLAVLAHELRNPLAPLSNSLEILERAVNDPDLRRESLATMRRQLGQLIRLVDDLLEVSRISQGKIQLRKCQIELAPAARQAWESALPLLERRGHVATILIADAPMYIVADAARIAQVISNLLNNAAKFTPPKGEIQLEVAPEGSQAVIRVRDTGVGIAPENLKYIFEPFAQVEAQLERNEAGLGIGLTLVRELIELHGGTIEAHSEGLGLGSEFVVRLPLAAPASAEGKARPTASPAQPERKKRQVLVVDDNRDSVQSMAMLLKLGGHEVLTAYDGLEAFEVASKARPDVIVLDIGLPRQNGYETARRIREQPWGRDTVLVAMTGWGQDEDRRQSEAAGFNHHLVKPIQHETLLKILRDL
jgi:signal transduction histidine kinase/CheY-like chemotaxis protein